MQESKGALIAILVVVLGLVGFGAWALMRDDNTSTSTSTSESQPAESQEAQAPESKNIVEIASGDPQFSTLVTAVTEAGLVETLSGEGPFTVFAPTNDAFDKLPEGALERLLANPDELKKVLTYHVVSGEVKATDVVKLSKAATVQGQEISIKVDGEMVKLNGNTTVTATDIMASNGVIHVIDTVLLPQ
jgi:uncharacterized surface protein with fasciclin (FAS1) repeats